MPRPLLVAAVSLLACAAPARAQPWAFGPEDVRVAHASGGHRFDGRQWRTIAWPYADGARHRAVAAVRPDRIVVAWTGRHPTDPNRSRWMTRWDGSRWTEVAFPFAHDGSSYPVAATDSLVHVVDDRGQAEAVVRTGAAGTTVPRRLRCGSRGGVWNAATPEAPCPAR